MKINYLKNRVYLRLGRRTFLDGISLYIFLFSFISCTNVAFQQSHEGPRGINFAKGACVVNEISSPYAKDENVKLNSIIMEYLHQMSDSVKLIESVRSSTPNGDKIPKGITNGLIDSLRKYTSYVYLLNVSFNPKGESSDNIYVNQSDFVDNQDSKVYLDNQVSVRITVVDILENKEIYKQEITATEMVDTENSLEKDESNVLFTRSSLNVAKNALIMGLRDIKKHSKKR